MISIKFKKQTANDQTRYDIIFQINQENKRMIDVISWYNNPDSILQSNKIFIIPNALGKAPLL